MNVQVLPTVVHIEVMRGTDNEFEFVIADGLGRPINITADTIKFTAKSALDGVATIPTKTNGPGQHTDAINGATSFVIPRGEIDDEASSSEITCWLYEVRRVDASNKENIHVQGQFIIRPDVGVS